MTHYFLHTNSSICYQNNVKKDHSDFFICFYSILVFITSCLVVYNLCDKYDWMTLSFYYIIMATGLILSVLATRLNNKISVFIVFLQIFLISFITGFRLDGVDDPAYRYIFQYGNSGDNSIEIGFVCLNKLFRFFSDDFNLFRFVISFITNFCFIWAFWKHRKLWSFPLCVLLFFASSFFYQMGLCLIRIYLAASIVFFHYSLVERKKAVSFAAVVVFASTIHTSALVNLLFLPFAIKKQSIKRSNLAEFLFVVLCLVAFATLAKFLVPIVSKRYVNYLSQDAGISGFMFFGYLVFLVFFLISFRLVEKKYHQKIYISILCIITYYVMSSGLFFIGGGRLTTYICNIIYSNTTLCYKKSKSYIFSMFLLGFLIVFSIFYIYSVQFKPSAQAYGYLFPYRNIFFTV